MTSGVSVIWYVLSVDFMHIFKFSNIRYTVPTFARSYVRSSYTSHPFRKRSFRVHVTKSIKTISKVQRKTVLVTDRMMKTVFTLALLVLRYAEIADAKHFDQRVLKDFARCDLLTLPSSKHVYQKMLSAPNQRPIYNGGLKVCHTKRYNQL